MWFPWPDARDQLLDFAAAFPSAVADERGVFTAADGNARLELPFVLPKPRPGQDAAGCAEALPDGPGRHVVLLMRAGAAAVGYWEDDDLVLHKAFKRYVVRGTGKAQPLHLKTRGKSRYGSRLRLQNWERLMAEVTERLREWWEDPGPPLRAYWSVPVRLLPELVRRGLPFDPRSAEARRIPLHVHEPDHKELLRVRALLARGHLELPAE